MYYLVYINLDRVHLVYEKRVIEIFVLSEDHTLTSYHNLCIRSPLYFDWSLNAKVEDVGLGQNVLTL